MNKSNVAAAFLAIVIAGCAESTTSPKDQTMSTSNYPRKIHIEVTAKTDAGHKVQIKDIEVLGEYSNFTKECSKHHTAVGPVDYARERRLVDANQNLSSQLVSGKCVLELQGVVVRSAFGRERVAEGPLLIPQSHVYGGAAELKCFDFGIGPPVCINSEAGSMNPHPTKLIGTLSIKWTIVE